MATKRLHSEVDAGHSTEAVFDLSLGIVTAEYAFESYEKPVRHQFFNFDTKSFAYAF